MIFKIQISIKSTEKYQEVLIYDESRTILWCGRASKKLKKIMNGRLKAYFEGQLIKKEININSDIEYRNIDW